MRLLSSAYRKHGTSILILAGLSFLRSLLEGVGVTALIPIFSLITKSKNLGDDLVSKSVQSLFSYFQIDYSLNFLIILVVVLFLLKFLLTIWADFVTAKIVTQYHEDTMRELFGGTVDASWKFLLTQKVGFLNTLLINNVKMSRLLLQEMSGLITFVVNIMVYCFIAFNVSASMTLVTISAGGVFILLSKGTISKIKEYSYFVNKLNKKIAHFVDEQLVGMKNIKAMSVGTKVKEEGYNYFEELKKFQTATILRKKINAAILQPLSVLYIVGIFLFFHSKPDFNIAVFAVIIFLIQRIFEYIKQAQSAIHTFGETLPYLRNILEYSDQVRSNREIDDETKPFHFDNNLEFRQVNFSYSRDRNILKNVNFVIKKGEMIGIVGPSGVGKTTIVDLLLRFFLPLQGSITIDGENISAIRLSEWRNSVGYISQDVFLSNNSIENNIKFFNAGLSKEQVIKAARMANIYDFIKNEKKGFLSPVGERGVLLSAGQRQRVAIARVLARDPKILILDEATSSLDNESERVIQEVVFGLKGKVTILVIAHRLKTVMGCDRILVVQDGTIVEEGGPQQLLYDPSSYFKRMYDMNSK